MENILCSVIVFVENMSCIDSLQMTLDSLKRQDLGGKNEIFLVSHINLPEWNGKEIVSLNDALKKVKGKYIFFTSVDTILIKNALKNMIFILENDRNVGAVGPLMNMSYFLSQGVFLGKDYANVLEMEECFADWKEKNSNVRKCTMHLDDNCMLMSYEVLQEVGLPDNKVIGVWSADICLRIIQAGYLLRICENSYAHCNRLSPSRDERQKAENAFFKKWGFGCKYSMDIRENLLEMTSFEKHDINVLDLGCSCGGNLMKIHNENPSARLYGIELNTMAAKIAGTWGLVLNENLETWNDFSWHEKFDVIIMGDILEHLRETSLVLKKVHSWLKPGGKLLLSVPNIMHISILKELLQEGRWSYRESGILDCTHIRFFTRKEIIMRLQEAGFIVKTITFTQSYVDSDMDDWLKILQSGKRDNLIEEDYKAFQWLLLSEKGEEINLTS